MFKGLQAKSLLLSTFLTFMFVFGQMGNGIAGEPPPSGSNIVGKAASGVLTAVIINIQNFPVVVASIIGECEIKNFVIGPLVNNPITPAIIGGITATDLENQYLKDADVAGCYSDLGTDDVVITTAKKFINTGMAISAEVTIRAVQSAP